MKVITKLDDLLELKSEGQICEEVFNYLHNHFHKVVRALRGDQPKEFDLTEYGPLVLLENDQDLKSESLKKVGLITGLLNASYECVEEIELTKQLSLWRIIIIHNNDFAVDYFLCSEDNFSPEVRGWLAKNCTAQKKSPSQNDTDLSDVPF